jgi:hypothetical protein
MSCKGSIVGAVGYRRLMIVLPEQFLRNGYMLRERRSAQTFRWLLYVRGSTVQLPNGHPQRVAKQCDGQFLPLSCASLVTD